MGSIKLKWNFKIERYEINWNVAVKEAWIFFFFRTYERLCWISLSFAVVSVIFYHRETQVPLGHLLKPGIIISYTIVHGFATSNVVHWESFNFFFFFFYSYWITSQGYDSSRLDFSEFMQPDVGRDSTWSDIGLAEKKIFFFLFRSHDYQILYNLWLII